MWTEGELHRVWAMITQSYVMLAVFIVPCLLLVIFLLFWSCAEKRQLAMQERMYSKTLEQMGKLNGHAAQPQQQQQMYSLPPSHNLERRKRYDSDEEEEEEGNYITLMRRERK